MLSGRVDNSRRLRREWKTMRIMVERYCAGNHNTAHGICGECSSFLSYASVRLDRCRFGQEKPTCANCPVHCYAGQRREQAKVIMRYAGPRMLWRHPYLSLMHWVDGFRKAPPLKD